MTHRRPLPPPSPADRAAMPRLADQFMWNDAQKLVAHRNMHHLFPSHAVKAGDAVRALPRRDEGALVAALARAGVDVDAYMAAGEATGLLVLRHGEIALERHARGNASVARNQSSYWPAASSTPRDSRMT